MKKTLLLMSLVLFTLSNFAFAQEEEIEIISLEEELATLEETDVEAAIEYDVIYGEVSKVDEEARTITILEYDYETEEEVAVTYKIGDEVELEEVNTLGEIKPGAWVDMEYYIDEDGLEVVVYIGAEVEPIFEEEEAEELEERE